MARCLTSGISQFSALLRHCWAELLVFRLFCCCTCVSAPVTGIPDPEHTSTFLDGHYMLVQCALLFKVSVSDFLTVFAARTLGCSSAAFRCAPRLCSFRNEHMLFFLVSGVAFQNTWWPFQDPSFAPCGSSSRSWQRFSRTRL